MRTVTAKNGADITDITWHYPTNLIWWYVTTLRFFALYLY